MMLCTYRTSVVVLVKDGKGSSMNHFGTYLKVIFQRRYPTLRLIKQKIVQHYSSQCYIFLYLEKSKKWPSKGVKKNVASYVFCAEGVMIIQ